MSITIASLHPTECWSLVAVIIVVVARNHNHVTYIFYKLRSPTEKKKRGLDYQQFPDATQETCP